MKQGKWLLIGAFLIFTTGCVVDSRPYRSYGHYYDNHCDDYYYSPSYIQIDYGYHDYGHHDYGHHRGYHRKRCR